MRVSIHGRRLGLSSTGGILAGSSGSTTFESIAQMWGADLIETVSSAGAAISNYGLTIISTDSTSGTSPFFVAAPVSGVSKEIHLQTSATLITLNSTATTIKFNTTSCVAAAGGSTVLSLANAAVAGLGGVVVLRGLSATAWGVVASDGVTASS